MDRQFLYYLTLSEPFRRNGEAAMKGAAGQKRVPEDFILDYPVAFPELQEQSRIADYLDRETSRIDALIVAKEGLSVVKSGLALNATFQADDVAPLKSNFQTLPRRSPA